MSDNAIYYDINNIDIDKKNIEFEMDYFYKYADNKLKNKSNNYGLIISVSFPIIALLLIIFDSYF